MFSSLKMYLWFAVSLIIGALTLGAVTFKKQRDQAVLERDIAKATTNANRVKARIEREEKAKQVSRRAEIVKEARKTNEEFKGSSNLTDSNDW